jgi:hypothetical protein
MITKIQKITIQTAALLTAALIGLTIATNAQNLGISATGVVPDASAGLDVNFTNKGVLIPRVALTDTTDAVTIPNPANSLLVYNTTNNPATGLTPGYYYNAGTPASPNWVRLLNSGSPSDAWLTLGNAGTNSGLNFIGTTDNRSLRFRTNNLHRMVIDSVGNVGIAIKNPTEKLTLPYTSLSGNILPQPNFPFSYSKIAMSLPYGIYLLDDTDYMGMLLKDEGANRKDAIIYWGDDITDNLRFMKSQWDGTKGNLTDYMIITGSGNVGIGTSTPTNKLEVNGSIVGGNVLAGAWEITGSTAVSINSTVWTDVPGMSITFNVTKPVLIYTLYSINVQPNSSPGSDYVLTRLVIDGTAYASTASHFQPYCNGDCNVNLNGQKILSLPAGSHTVKLQWRVWNGTLTWSNDPNWCDGYCGGRSLTVLAFYQ